ncbi:MAG: hypothetical protein ACXVFM_09675 [Solirubrobacteraceae bacterium]
MSRAPGGEPRADVLLSSCLGAPVRRGGRRIGHLADLVVAPGGPAPAVTGVVVRRRGSPPAWTPWGDVERLDGDGVILAPGAALEAPPTVVLLARDVLDAQLVDLAGRRVVRVGDVYLRLDDRVLLVEGVEAGLDSVLRRLGLQRLARRAPRDAIAWNDLHLPAHPGAALSLERAAPAFERLDAAERARLAARLPAHVATTLLRVPRHRIPLRFPTHVLRRRRAPR